MSVRKPIDLLKRIGSGARRRPIRLIGAVLLLAMPAACAFCIANVVPPQAIEHTHFCAEYLAQGKLTEGEARCQLAIEFCPKCAEPHNLLGLIEYNRGKIERAIDELKIALSLKNDFPEALNNLGAIYLEVLKDFDQACDLFKQALEIDPGYQNARRNHATCLMRVGDNTGARNEYLKCVEIDPGYCDCRLGLGVLALNAKDLQDAKTHFQKVTQTCPQAPEGFYNLCIAYFNLARCADAVDACTHALALNPDYLEARKNLTEAYECLAMQDASLKQIIRQLKKNPGDPELHFRLASIYEDEQLWERALTEYNYAIKLNPRYTLAYFRAARVLDRMLRAQETVQMCQHFVDQLRDDTYRKQRTWCVNRVRELQFQ